MAEYIEREKAKDELLSWAVCIKHPRHLSREDALCVLDSIPAADVAPVVHGTWEERDDGWGGTYYHCSACGEDWCTIEGTTVENSMKYCPKCGAKMDQEG